MSQKSKISLKEEIREAVKSKTGKPKMFEVIMLNDDFTPMDFVVYLLKKYFHMSHELATDMMLKIHHEGEGVCGIYTKDIAETKMHDVILRCRANDYPTKIILRRQ